MLYTSFSIFAVQVKRIRITQFPSVWNVGDNAALMCYVQLTRPGPVPVITWRNSTGLVTSSDTVRVSETTPITSSIVTSVMEFVSLQAQSQVYYCHALIAGAGGVSAWHHVKVNSKCMLDTIFTQSLLLFFAARIATSKCFNHPHRSYQTYLPWSTTLSSLYCYTRLAYL